MGDEARLDQRPRAGISRYSETCRPQAFIIAYKGPVSRRSRLQPKARHQHYGKIYNEIKVQSPQQAMFNQHATYYHKNNSHRNAFMDFSGTINADN